MLREEVLNTIKKYNLIENNDKIAVGVSGGPDSICLVDILYNLKKEGIINFEIIVCHVNHMIREEADSDEDFVRRYCAKRAIPFEAKKVDINEISKEKKLGSEETGREERYKFFNEILEKYNANKIATAHTKSDNAETVLMNILRGTGTSGLKGIQAVRDKKYIRPLIEIKRADIERYCEEEALNPRHDKTNDENIYTRNKVRNVLIPLINEEFNPNIIDTLNRLSEVIRIDNDYLEKETEKTFYKLVIKQEKDEIILNLKEFNKEHEAIKSRIILLCIKKLLGTTNGIGKIHIRDIMELCANNIGNKYLTPNKTLKILVNKGKMYFFVTKKT